MSEKPKQVRRKYHRESRFPAAVRVSLKQSTFDMIEAEADKRGVSISQIAREIVEAGLPLIIKPS